MSLYAVFTADGLGCLGIYDTAFWPDQNGSRNKAIPSGAAAITEDQRNQLVTNPNGWMWNGKALVAYTPPPVAPKVPDSASLSDWRVGVLLWNRMDSVTASVNALMASTDGQKKIAGKIANERLQYANTVQRAELIALKDAFGFTQDDVDESMWRAAQVAKGDLTGIWPLDQGNTP